MYIKLSSCATCMHTIFKWAENPVEIAQVFIGKIEEKRALNLCFEGTVQTKIKLHFNNQLCLFNTSVTYMFNKYVLSVKCCDRQMNTMVTKSYKSTPSCLQGAHKAVGQDGYCLDTFCSPKQTDTGIENRLWDCSYQDLNSNCST